MKIVNRIIKKELPKEPETTSVEPMIKVDEYIGIGKLCCMPCKSTIEIVEIEQEAAFCVCGTHGSTYKSWLVPDNISENSKQKLLEKMEDLCLSERQWDSTGEIPLENEFLLVMEIDNPEPTTSTGITADFSQPNLVDWTNIHPNFTDELIQVWQNLNFTYDQTQDWANAFGFDFNPSDYEFVNWLANTKGYSVEQILNQFNLENLRLEYQASQQQAQVIHQPYGTPGSSK